MATTSRFFRKGSSSSSNESDKSDLDGESNKSNKRSRYEADFEEEKSLGKGTSGEVMKCKHRLDGQTYAVKVLKFAEKDKEEVLREVLILAGLYHENIVRYHQAWIEKDGDDDGLGLLHGESDIQDNTLFIQMEYCKRNLLGLLRENPGFECRLLVAKKIVKGLSYIHENHFVHRDLSADNIFISMDDDFEELEKVKIGDFGIAVSCDGSVKVEVKRAEGHDIYKAPEVREMGLINEKADVFSLGIILFELLQPCTSNIQTRINNIKDLRELKFPSDWEESPYKNYKPLISKLLSKNPDDRPSVGEVLQLLEEDEGGHVEGDHFEAI